MVMEWDEATHREIPRNLYTVGEDGVTADNLANLDRMDHEEDLNERYERENRDKIFGMGASSNEPDNPIDDVPDPSADVHNLAFPEELQKDPLLEKARDFIENDLTESQKDFVFDHFGSGLSLEEIRRREEAGTGEKKSQQAYANRKTKIREKAGKFFGVKPARVRKEE